MKSVISVSMIAAGLLGNNSENIDHKNNFIEHNKAEYQQISKDKMLTKSIEDHASYLSLPVHLYVFNYYYNYYYSEYQYLDRYKYNDKVLIFDKNSDVTPSKYNNSHWLENLEQTKEFTKQHTVENNSYGYDKSKNIDWVNGRTGDNFETGGDVKLKNILTIQTPEATDNAFSKHIKNIELSHNHKHGKYINEYAGYWRDGKIADPNIYFQINYGKIKEDKDIKYWYKAYERSGFDPHKKWPSCDSIRKFSKDTIGHHNNFSLKEGFDSKCDQISLQKKGFKFHQKDSKYTSGYAAYRNVSTHWKTSNLYYYLLGNLYDEQQNYSVNENKTNETLWYVDYDDVFVLDVEELDKTNKKVKFSIKINDKKIKNVSDFLTVSSGLKFNLNFKIDNEDKTATFTMDDVFNEKQHTFNFSNYKPEILFNDMHIKLIKNNDYVELISDKQYRVSTMFNNKNSFTFDELIFKPVADNEFFYSEILDKKKWHNLFYLQSKEQNLTTPLDSSYWEKLNPRFVGSDQKSTMTLTYYDFLTQKDVTVSVDKLKTLPEITYFDLVKDKSQNKVIINKGRVVSNDYFWQNISLELKETNLFDGIETYQIKITHPDTERNKEWGEFYKNKKLLFVTEPSIKVKGIVDETNWSNNFYVTDDGKTAGWNMSDFQFSQASNKKDSLSLLAQVNKRHGIYAHKVFDIKKSSDFDAPSTKTKKEYVAYPTTLDTSRYHVTEPIDDMSDMDEDSEEERKMENLVNENSALNSEKGNFISDFFFSKKDQKNYPLIFSSIAAGGGVVSLLGLQTVAFIKRF